MPDLPTGTVTFLFTDIEQSTRLWEEHREAMEAAVAWAREPGRPAGGEMTQVTLVEPTSTGSSPD